MDGDRLPLKSIFWWTGFCIIPHICYSVVLVSWKTFLVKPARGFSLPLKVPALVIGPAITPFAFSAVKTMKEVVEPDDSKAKFRRTCKTRLKPQISLLHSMINFVVTSILSSVVVFLKAGAYTHWLHDSCTFYSSRNPIFPCA